MRIGDKISYTFTLLLILIWIVGIGGILQIGSMLIILLMISTIIGVFLIIPISKNIKTTTSSLESIIKTGFNTSINVSNIAAELAANTSEVNAAAEEIEASVQDLARDSQSIAASSDEIRNIMEAITMISEQTNLLALNASIEAGRAGEHGRGFAVVADEVRKLAEESKKTVRSTNDKVKDIISRIQASAVLIEEINESSEQQTVSMEEISSTASRLGDLALELKDSLAETVKVEFKDKQNSIFDLYKESTEEMTNK